MLSYITAESQIDKHPFKYSILSKFNISKAYAFGANIYIIISTKIK